MVASDVVPFDAIGIEVVQDSNAHFIAVTVIRLGLRNGLFAGIIESNLSNWQFIAILGFKN